MELEQKQAREAKSAHDAGLQSFHGYVHQQLQTQRRDEILRKAAERIAIWKKNKLCSSYYIRFWTSVVAAGDSETFRAKVLNASKRRSVAMMQNTPFSFLMKERN